MGSEVVWSLLTPGPGEPCGRTVSLFGGPMWDRALHGATLVLSASWPG